MADSVEIMNDSACFVCEHGVILLFFISQADRENAAVITSCGGIPLIIQCLSSPVRNTVSELLMVCLFVFYLYSKYKM